MTKPSRKRQKSTTNVVQWFMLTISALATFWGAHWIANTAQAPELTSQNEPQLGQPGNNQPNQIGMPVARSRSSR